MWHMCIIIWSKTCALVCQGFHSRVLQTGWLTEMYFLTILESRSLKSMCWQVWILLKLLSLACRCLSSIVFLLCLHFVQVCVQISLSYKNISQIGWGLTLMTLFYLNYLFKVPIPKYSTLILRYQELELQYRSVEEKNSACNGLFSLQSATEALENKSFSVPQICWPYYFLPRTV